MDQLYMGDMLGAGVGVLIALLVMHTLGTAAAVKRITRKRVNVVYLLSR